MKTTGLCTIVGAWVCDDRNPYIHINCLSEVSLKMEAVGSRKGSRLKLTSDAANTVPVWRVLNLSINYAPQLFEVSPNVRRYRLLEHDQVKPRRKASGAGHVLTESVKTQRLAAHLRAKATGSPTLFHKSVFRGREGTEQDVRRGRTRTAEEERMHTRAEDVLARSSGIRSFDRHSVRRSCTASNPAKRVGGSKPSEPPRPSTSSEKSPGVSLRGAASAVRASNELSRPQTSSQASSSPGTIAGSLGGSGGRAIRDSRKSLSDAETSLTNSIPELKNGKVDTIEVLTRRVDALEVSEAAMQRVIKELRDEIALLKQHQQR
eukprot:gene501-534_t